MTVEPTLDPELRALLQEIAANPRARLFRERIPKPTRLPLTEIPWVRPTATGLTSAEAHLLRVHREEVARLLRQASEWKLQQDPVDAAQVSPWIDGRRRRGFPTLADLLCDLRGAAARGVTVEDPGTGRAVELSSSLLRTRNTAATQLAGLSLRLLPHDSAWVNIARSLRIGGQLRDAISLLNQVLRRQQAQGIMSSAWTWLGACYDLVGDAHNSTLCYGRASQESAEATPNSLMSWLVEATLSRQVTLVSEAAVRIEDMLGGAPVAVQGWTQGLRIRRQLGLVRVQPASQRLAMDLEGRWGLSTDLVLDGLLKV